MCRDFLFKVFVSINQLDLKEEKWIINNLF
jgi:hypothetical protein